MQNDRFNEGESPFIVKDCALAAIATGKRAQNIRELLDNIRTISAASIYYHFWGGLLRPRFDDPEYNNDLAIWAFYGLQDTVLAERLGIIHPNDYSDLEALRGEIIDVLEERLDEMDWVPWAKADNQFYFVRSQIVVFDTMRRIRTPEELARLIPDLSLGSIFYHFIDAQRRSPKGIDDFQAWLMESFQGYDALCRSLDALDPFFSGLNDLRTKLIQIFRSYT